MKHLSTSKFFGFLLSAAVLLLVASRAAAQVYDPAKMGVQANENLKDLTRGANVIAYDNRYEGIRGTPFAFSRWLPADLVMTSNAKLHVGALKFDAYQQQFYIKSPDKRDSLLIDSRRIARFTLIDSGAFEPATQGPWVHQFRRFAEAPVSMQANEFVESLYEGRYALLKRYGKQLVKANYMGAYSQDRRTDEMIDQIQYFLRRPTGSVVGIKLNTKSLAAAAPELAAPLQGETGHRQIGTEQELITFLRTLDKAK
ncbi:hypothetical protein [Hymenobacter jejuensis]|uniref:Uncharacterized protein n=1 Tax=Hymenobacter jejuensis TaxID=2502781 RepID=A0A5B7ZUM9_9BACT|nr:hypothetical protein [Hymenobacter jejuensis]QDA58670.1 hypothetical protein FHG12_00495 [Hymenobacter jejuensis]